MSHSDGRINSARKPCDFSLLLAFILSPHDYWWCWCCWSSSLGWVMVMKADDQQVVVAADLIQGASRAHPIWAPHHNQQTIASNLIIMHKLIDPISEQARLWGKHQGPNWCFLAASFLSHKEWGCSNLKKIRGTNLFLRWLEFPTRNKWVLGAPQSASQSVSKSVSQSMAWYDSVALCPWRPIMCRIVTKNLLASLPDNESNLVSLSLSL